MLIPRRVKHRKQHHPQPDRRGQGRHPAHLRRLRHPGARARLRDQPADRVGPYRDDPAHQAWRQGLDQHLPGPPADQEARRDPHGFRQGLAGVVGRQRQARPGACSSCPAPRRAVAREALRRAMHKLPMKCRIVTPRGGDSDGQAATGRRAARADRRGARDASCARPRRSCSTSASRRRPGSWRTTAGCAPSARTSPGSTP